MNINIESELLKEVYEKMFRFLDEKYGKKSSVVGTKSVGGTSMEEEKINNGDVSQEGSQRLIVIRPMSLSDASKELG